MSGEKTEKATPKKLRDARRDGKVARSAEFTSTAVAVAALATVVVSGSWIAAHLASFLRQCISLATEADPANFTPDQVLLKGLDTLLHTVGPILAVAFVVAACVGYFQIGPVFTIKPLIPDSKRLNIAEGFKNILFSRAKLVELAKNLGKLSIMAVLGLAVFDAQLQRLLRTPRVDLDAALQVLVASAFDLAKYLVGGLIVFAILDLLWQRHKFAKDMMMSKHDVKEEYKQSEGDPQMKGKRKRFHRELLKDQSLAQVKNADAVVVNPTHVAVAIRYRENEMDAPTVIARGRGEMAHQIRRLARRHRVPIVRNVSLARALVEVELEEQIPEELYEAVAEVLHFVYTLGRT